MNSSVIGAIQNDIGRVENVNEVQLAEKKVSLTGAGIASVFFYVISRLYRAGKEIRRNDRWLMGKDN